AEPAGARARQRRIARTRRGPRAARRLHQRVARDGRGRLDRRPDRFRRHHHSARDPPHRRPRSPPGAARGHALRRRFSGRLRSDRAYTARARRTARRHHHRPAGRPVLLMAPRQKTLIAVWLATLLALSAAASPRQQPAPSPGQQVRRIISLVPAVTEMLFAIGAGPRVVAVSSYDTYPPEVKGLPGVGALLDPNVERILSLQPDLVIVYGSQTDLMKQLDRAGIAAFNYRHGGLGAIADTIRRLGQRTGDAAEADAVAARIDRGLDEIRAKVKDKPRPRTLLVFGRERFALRGIYASGGVGFLHD